MATTSLNKVTACIIDTTKLMLIKRQIDMTKESSSTSRLSVGDLSTVLKRNFVEKLYVVMVLVLSFYLKMTEKYAVKLL